MSITDELRKYADRLSDEAARKSEHGFSPVAMALEGIADRIDAEHEAKVSYWQGASYKDGYDEGFASADDWLAQHEDAMAEHGWVRLPKDADGVPIHIGDDLDYLEALAPGVPARFKVESMYYFEKNGKWRLRAFPATYDPRKCRHHHAPTVEDVLREFAEKMAENTAMYVAESWDADERDEADAAAIAEYAAKLRLADDGKEQ